MRHPALDDPGDRVISRRGFVFAATISLLAAPLAVQAQPAGRIPRIGLFSGGAPPGPNTFRQGLQDLGYVEGWNIVIEDRFAKSYEDLPALAADLVRLKVGVIVAFGSPAAQVARDSIQTIPIIFVTFADPVQTGLVASLARPGRNLTGLTMITSEPIGKRVELLKEGLPKISRLAVLLNSTNPSSGEQWRETQAAARSLGIRVETHEVRVPDELEGVFATIRERRADALLTLADSMLFFERRRIVALAAKSRLPTMFHWRGYVDAGGLMSYGPSFSELNRRAPSSSTRSSKTPSPRTFRSNSRRSSSWSST